MEYLNIEQISGMVIAYLPKVAGAILTLLIGFWIAGLIARLFRKTLKKEV